MIRFVERGPRACVRITATGRLAASRFCASAFGTQLLALRWPRCRVEAHRHYALAVRTKMHRPI